MTAQIVINLWQLEIITIYRDKDMKKHIVLINFCLAAVLVMLSIFSIVGNPEAADIQMGCHARNFCQVGVGNNIPDQTYPGFLFSGIQMAEYASRKSSTNDKVGLEDTWI